jgi:hypothetical protein
MPAELEVKAGNLVFWAQDDGQGEIIGRVVAVDNTDVGTATEIMWVPAAIPAVRRGGVLLGASPTLTFEEAARLVISPNSPSDEAVIARDTIWPSVEKSLLPAIVQNLQAEGAGLAALNDSERRIFANIVAQLHRELLPLEDELFARLADRSWRVIGLRGIALGIWRESKDKAGYFLNDPRNWLSRLSEVTDKNDSAPHQGFLSDETQTELREALVDETKRFWAEHRDEIMEKADRVLARSVPALEKMVRTNWGPRLFEHVLIPSWRSSEADIVRAVEAYANDFAWRRLLTHQGGSRLTLAHALRSGLGIDDAPLLIFVASKDETREVKYQPLIPGVN